jgi:hypothetical protein
MVFSI